MSQEIKSLGGKHSLGTSSVIAEEQRNFETYKKRLNDLGVVNSEESAHKLRGIIADFMPDTKEIMNVLGFSF